MISRSFALLLCALLPAAAQSPSPRAASPDTSVSARAAKEKSEAEEEEEEARAQDRREKREREEAPKALAAAASEPILPPLIPWEGKSRELIVAADDSWVTPAEKSNFETTPTYAETVAWLQKLVAAAPERLHMLSLGKSPEGRDLWLVVATQAKEFTPEALRKSGLPIVFAQAGIHSGEIDGKDAGLMLLRDLTVRGTKSELLERANFLFVPIFNVDGHEHSSRYGRPNQRGPREMGWRTTSQNLNLNRDYAKADATEMQLMLAALQAWTPDLYLDLHVTDGADYQYDVTFGGNTGTGHSPGISDWLTKNFGPAVTKDLANAGHIPGPVEAPNWIDPIDWRKGITEWLADPRFSTGYGDVRHLPTVLVETHALKPYQQRVLGTYVLLESALRTVGKESASLRSAIEADRKRRNPTVPLSWDVAPKTTTEKIEYKGVEARAVPSAISGGVRMQFTGQPATALVPFQRQNHVATSVTRPKAYWIPPAWTEVIARLERHGIQFERIKEPREGKVGMYRLEEAKFETEAFEGRVRLQTKPVLEERTEKFAPGAVRVPTDQALGDLAVILLEPTSPDSFLQWGFFNEVLQRTEYIEPYVIEPMAERMMAADPALAEEFREKLAKDDAFRSSATERLRWFYAKTPFMDDRWKLYPVAREE